MPRRRRSSLSQAERDAYLMSRTLGDVRAAERGRLGKRLIRRYYHRGLINFLRRSRLW